MEPLRIGFIGAGIMATWAIYPALYLAPLALQAVCDIDEARAKSVAGKFGTGRWYTDYREMFAKEDLEALIIQMYPEPRQPIVLEALQAGYHVFIPKPPAMSLSAALDLAQAAHQTGKTLMVNFQRRFSFGVSRAREIMTTPSFGQLTQLFCSFCSGPYDQVRSQAYEGPEQAYLLDFALHHFDLACYLGGAITKVALFHQQVGQGLALAVALEFMSGAVGTLQLNSQRLWWRNYDRLEMTGQGEYLVVDGLWSLKHYTSTNNSFTENYSDERSSELTGDGPALIEFVEAIRQGREPIANIHDCLEAMKLYHTIYDAVRQKRDGVILG